MSGPFVSRVGGILSADIAVPEHEKEKEFYARVLTTGESPLWQEDLMNNQGTPIIGLGERTPEYAKLPLQWIPHIQVADVAASVDRAVALGGTELFHGKDETGNSLWAGVQDPNGAVFGLIPIVASEHLPPTVNSDMPVGCIVWFDLSVPQAVSTGEFYGEVIGWSVEEVSVEDAGERYTDYAMMGGDGGPAAGICHARGANADMPAGWMMYLPVGDFDQSVGRVASAGGKVLKAATSPDGSFRFAVIEDPVGAIFALTPAG